MKNCKLFILLIVAVLGFYPDVSTAQKPRVFVLTDIENEPDDAMSMVRFLTYSNHWDVEGLVATTSIHQRDKTAAWRIREIVEAYGEVRDNLELHESGFPTANQLLSLIREGRPDYGMYAVGEGMDSPGSELLIEVVDRDDARPVWVTVWGGPNVLAQALWKVRATRSAAALETFISKLRVYTISDQDDSGPWMRKTFPNLFYIASPGVHAGGGYHYATWSGISGDKFHARFVGADFSIVDNPWLDEHIRSKGPLGAQYPWMTFLMEGDTPSFLNLINNGLSNPEHPDWGGWGGRYEYYTPRWEKQLLEPEIRPLWTDAEDEVLGVDGGWHSGNHETIWRWRPAFQNDFAARMDWTIKPYDEANHPPVVKPGHLSQITAKPGERVNLSAAGTSDPDGDALSYEWFLYKEPGTFTMSNARSGQPLVIENADKSEATFTVPVDRVLRNGTMHIILAVTDNGTPRLTRYQRVIVDVVATDSLANALNQSPAWSGSAEAIRIAEHASIATGDALSGVRHRVLVSTDIGGTDPDDFQSMVHLLLYADVLDIEGLISSPYGPGRKRHILQVIDHYEQDLQNLKSYSDAYPTAEALRNITKQGAVEGGYSGFGSPTEGSQWIIDRARADDPRPLYLLVWGGIEDLAQALHDAPDILPKLRVYWIGGPNKKWSPDAYLYIAEHHPALWIIEANATYRGWFVGGNQAGDLGNTGFVQKHVAGKGALGNFFTTQLGGTIKMGDTPSVGWLLRGTPDDPSKPGWGGRFVRAWDRPFYQFDRLPTMEDRMEAFGILELALPLGADTSEKPEAKIDVGNQLLIGHFPGDGTVRFRFSPKAASTYHFTVRSNAPALNGMTGSITSFTPPPDMAQHPSAKYPNWWTDDPAPAYAEGPHIGAKTVSRWREDFLQDFALRISRCAIPASNH